MMTVADLREGYALLGVLRDANANMGGAVQKFLAYEQEHGHLPPDQLRTLGAILGDLGLALRNYADKIDVVSTLR
jgi:hypothetical protein